MTDFLFFKPFKLEQFRQKDKYLIPQDMVILGDWKPDLPVEVQGYLKVYGDLRVEGGSLTVKDYIFTEMGCYAKGDIIAGHWINAGDSITSEEGDITAGNDIRTTGNLIAGGGDINTGEGFGIFACGRIEAQNSINNGSKVFAGVATWDDANPQKDATIKAKKIKNEDEVAHGEVELEGKAKKSSKVKK